MHGESAEASAGEQPSISHVWEAEDCPRYSDVRRLELDCGIAYGRLAAWLDDELGLAGRDGAWLFMTDGLTCTIALDPLPPRHMGRFALERTRLVAEGPASAVDTFERLFTLRFMSAGG